MSTIGVVRAWARLLRVKHWMKNALVFLPLAFSGHLLEPQLALAACAAFASFSLAASVVYVLNDWSDREADRAHPTKRNRPLASGAINPWAAVVAVPILAVASAACLVPFWSGKGSVAFFLIVLYVALNIAYSRGLKHRPIADVAVLASGFVLRVLVGGVACGISVSAWMLLTVLSLSLFLALGKRRGELVAQGDSGRRVLKAYSVGFLERSMGTFEACGLVFYSLWSLERLGGEALLSSIRSVALVMGVAVVMMLFLRYSYVVERGVSDGDPVGVVLSDKPLLLLVAAWACAMAFALYG